MLSNMKVMVGLLLILTGFVYFLVNTDNNDAPVGTGAWLLPVLQQDAVSRLTEIKITKGQDSISLVKKDQLWYVAGGFYADTGPMMQLLQALRSAEKIEAKTSNPENFKQLQVSEDDLMVTLRADNKTLAEVHLGKQATASGGSFARLAGDNQTWLVTAINQVAFMSDDWQLKTITDHNAEALTQVRIDNGTGAVVRLGRDAITRDWVLADIPNGKQAKVDVPWIQLASGLSRFTIEAALPLDLNDKALKITANYQLLSGEDIEVKVYQHAADYYVTLNLEKYKGWMFKVPSYKFDALNQSMLEFIEDATSSTPVEEVADVK